MRPMKRCQTPVEKLISEKAKAREDSTTSTKDSSDSKRRRLSIERGFLLPRDKTNGGLK